MIRECVDIALSEQQAAQVYLADDYPHGGQRIKKIDSSNSYVLMRGSKLAFDLKETETRYGYAHAVAAKLGKSLAQKLKNSGNTRIAVVKTKYDLFEHGNHRTRQAMYSDLIYSFCDQYNKHIPDTYELYLNPQIALFKVTDGYAIVRGDDHQLQRHISLKRAYKLAQSILLAMHDEVLRIDRSGNITYG